jgi:hypothetical protein
VKGNLRFGVEQGGEAAEHYLGRAEAGAKILDSKVDKGVRAVGHGLKKAENGIVDAVKGGDEQPEFELLDEGVSRRRPRH